MNLEEIKELIRVFGRSKLDKLKIKDGEFEVSMSKESGTNVAVAQTAPVAQVAPVAAASIAVAEQPQETLAAVTTQEGELIRSPMVGTFYAAPSPDSAPFVKVGDTVNKGQVLCILEAMKIMNELEAEFSCKILEVLVEDGQPVEYDMPLFRVERI